MMTQDNQDKRLPKVSLRAMELEDLEILYDVENDRANWDLGATNVPYSRMALTDFIVNAANDIYADRQLRLMVENEQGEVVAMADLVNFDPQHHRAELGLIVRDAYRRQGYAQAALVGLLRYCREVIHLHQVYAVVDAENQACRQSLRQGGFKEVATLPDWLFDGEDYREAIVCSFLVCRHS